jgi:hypothetical protein
VILPVKRIDLELDSLLAPIPTPTHKQFVVGRTATLDAYQDRCKRIAFWIKEALSGGCRMIYNSSEDTFITSGPLYGRVSVSWSFGRGRHGNAFQSLRKAAQSLNDIEFLKHEPIRLSLSGHRISNGTIDHSHPIEETTPGRFECEVGIPINFEWKIANNSGKLYLFNFLILII